MTVLGPVGTVEGFDAFWTAASEIDPDLVGAADYPHHRHGDTHALSELLGDSGWTHCSIDSIVGVRACTDETLWRWLWGSLPLRKQDGSHIEGESRTKREAAIRERFFELARPWQRDGVFAVHSRVHIASAIASGRNPC